MIEGTTLLGRDDELALALEAIAGGRSVVLTGAAGVGKTRLAREVVARSSLAGSRTEWIAATEAAASIPLAAMARLVPAAAIGKGRDETLRAVVGALADARDAQLVIGIDDAHLLDDASAALAHLLVTSRTASAVITVRHHERVPDAIARVWQDEGAPLIALQPLARPEVEQLVQQALGGDADRALLQFLWETCRGNSLFLHELLRDGVQSGSVRHEDGRWRWRGPFQPGARLQDIVAMRMGRVDQYERNALEMLAIGGPLQVDCVASLALESAVVRLERRGLVTADPETREVNVAHPLFGEVVRTTIPIVRLDRIRLALAHAVEATAEPTPNVAIRVALWRAEAGDRTNPSRFVAAARQAWAIGASTATERLARAALDAGRDLEAGYLLGEALSEQGRSEEALTAFRSVEHLPGSDYLHARVAQGQAGVLAYQLDRPDEALELYHRAIARVADEEVRGSLRGTARMLSVTHRAGGRTRVDEVPTDHPPTPAEAIATATTLLTEGHLVAAVAVVDEVMARAPEWAEREPAIAVLLALVRVWALALTGEVQRACDAAEDGYAECVVQGVDQRRAEWCLGRGLTSVLAGRPRTAIAALEEAVAVMERSDTVWVRPTEAQLAMAHALTGDVAAARHSERAAGAAVQSLDGVFGVEVLRAGAWVRAAEGDISGAALRAEAAGDCAAAQGQPAFEMLALHDVARFCRPAHVAARLERLANVVDGPLIDAIAVHAQGLAHDDGDVLDRASRSFEQLGCTLFAVEASASATRCHRRAGRRATGYVEWQRALELARRCEGGRPAVPWGDEPDELTEREREIADLAAGGLASRAIGLRLGISPRTVDNLLGRVYSKLGLSGRRQLTATLRRRE